MRIYHTGKNTSTAIWIDNAPNAPGYEPRREPEFSPPPLSFREYCGY